MAEDREFSSALISRAMARDADWDEGKHKRDHGKFSSTGTSTDRSGSKWAARAGKPGSSSPLHPGKKVPEAETELTKLAKKNVAGYGHVKPGEPGYGEAVRQEALQLIKKDPKAAKSMSRFSRMTAKDAETKHDPKDGRFTSGSGSGGQPKDQSKTPTKTVDHYYSRWQAAEKNARSAKPGSGEHKSFTSEAKAAKALFQKSRANEGELEPGGRHGYNPEAVTKAIKSSSRHGAKIGGKEAKAIHRLLRGR